MSHTITFENVIPNNIKCHGKVFTRYTSNNNHESRQKYIARLMAVLRLKPYEKNNKDTQ